MAPESIQVHYEQLAEIAARFGRRAAANQELARRIKEQAEGLITAGWQGQGAQAFADELRGELLPALDRLSAILHEGQAVTEAISARFREGEEQAARLFIDDPAQGGASGAAEPPGGWQTTGSGQWSYGPASVSGRTAEREAGMRADGSGTAKIDDLNKKNQELGFRYRAISGTLGGGKGAEGAIDVGPVEGTGAAKIEFGAYEIGGGVEAKDGALRAGGYGEISVVKAEAEGVIGDADAGLTGGIKGKLLGLDGFGGAGTDGLGLKGGLTVASVEAEGGVNVGGYNVSVGAEAGLKWEWGLKWGPKTEVELPFFSLSFSFGKAKTGKLD